MSFVPSDDSDALRSAEEQLDNLVQELAHLDFLARRSVANGDDDTAAEVGHRVGHILHNLTYGWTPTLIMHLAHHVNIGRNEAGLATERFRETSTILKEVAIMMGDLDVPMEVCMKLLDVSERMQQWADESRFEPIPDEEMKISDDE